MRRFWLTLPFASLLLGGCRIEQTPPEYIDVLEIPQDEIEASDQELTDRLRTTGSALGRRNFGDLLAALTPAPDFAGYGPDVGRALTDGTALAAALVEPTGGRAVSVQEVEVEVGPRNNVAWFRTEYLAEGGEGATTVRFSGVFLREGGEWRLIHAHVSPAITPGSVPPAPEAGTPGGGG